MRSIHRAQTPAQGQAPSLSGSQPPRLRPSPWALSMMDRLLSVDSENRCPMPSSFRFSTTKALIFIPQYIFYRLVTPPRGCPSSEKALRMETATGSFCLGPCPRRSDRSTLMAFPVAHLCPALSAQAQGLSGLSPTSPLSKGASLSPSPTRECWPILCRACPMLSPSGKGWGGTCDIQRHTEVATSVFGAGLTTVHMCVQINSVPPLLRSHLPSPRLSVETHRVFRGAFRPCFMSGKEATPGVLPGGIL